MERGRSFQLTEEDLFRASRAVLHATRTCIKNIYNIKIIIGFDKTHVVLRATTRQSNIQLSRCVIVSHCKN